MPTYKEIRGDVPWLIPVGYMAANVTGGSSLLVPFTAKIISAKVIPSAAITANGTNFFTMSFFNRGGAGAGSVQWATARAWSAGNSSKGVPEALTLSSTASDLLIAANDVLNVECAPSGTGLIWPGGVVQLMLRAR
jgi:hypothetical protein